jgi:hypothetical protein
MATMEILLIVSAAFAFVSLIVWVGLCVLMDRRLEKLLKDNLVFLDSSLERWFIHRLRLNELLEGRLTLTPDNAYVIIKTTVDGHYQLIFPADESAISGVLGMPPTDGAKEIIRRIDDKFINKRT